MNLLEKYYGARERLSYEQFARTYPHGFLVKKPGVSLVAGDIEFRTAFLSPGKPLPEMKGDDWAAVPLLKRAGNPFPERITIGRANNADVVVRASFISKIHVRVLVAPDGALQICDGGSANGSRLNGVALTSEPIAFLSGDRLDLATLPLTLFGPEESWELLGERGRGGPA